jgi:ParB family chromosome partitioning protein
VEGVCTIVPTLTDLHPRYLIPHERNLRTDVGDVADLMASITAVGILQPLLVVPLAADEIPDDARPDDAGGEGPGWFQIIVGHRRHAAAVHLGLASVPCLVATDEGDADRIVKILAENVHRVGLTATEEANGYHQLALLDWTPEQISQVTAKPAERIRQALTLVSLPQQVRQAADDGQLDLADAAALTDFDDKTVQRILSRGRGWGFSHAVAEERSKIERRDAAERAKAELVLAGVKVTPKPRDYGYASKEAPASTLLDADGNRLDPDQVKALPGFAAFVDGSVLPPRVEVYCTDPEAHGYTRTRHTSYVPSEVAEQRAKEQAEREAYLQALTVAASVREGFLTATYGTVRGAKRAQIEALRAAVTDPAAITVPDTKQALLTRLAGCDPVSASATAGTDRLTRILVARWLTAAEANLDKLIHGYSWQADPAAGIAYLDRLVQAGYELSDAEQRLHTDLTTRLADDADDEETEDDEAGEDDSADGDEDGDPDDAAADGDADGDSGDGLATDEYAPSVDDVDPSDADPVEPVNVTAAMDDRVAVVSV